jgi:hypothetical protein
MSSQLALPYNELDAAHNAYFHSSLSDTFKPLDEAFSYRYSLALSLGAFSCKADALFDSEVASVMLIKTDPNCCQTSICVDLI